jgi:predicted Zn-dependent peptidase
MPVTFEHTTLPNGLTIIAETDPAAHSSAAGFFVKTGARDETPDIMGVSHYLEHMMFKGTEKLSAHDLNQRFDDMGARNNAYTTSEATCFYAHVIPERLAECIDLLGRMLRPALRDSDFTTEKSVILEEIAMYKDNPYWVLFEAALEKHFGPHPMAHRVLGTDATIAAMQRDQMKGYFDARYSADNTIVSLAGRVDFKQAVDQIAALCGGWERTGARRESHRPRVGGGEFTLRDAKVTRGYILGIADAPAVDDDRRYAATLLSQVLGAADNSRLHWSLIETGLAEEAQAAYEPHDGTGEFLVYASGDPERLDEIWSVVQREIGGLVASLTEDDLERLRNRLATAVTLGGERPNDRMQRIGRLWAYLGHYKTLEEELERINAVTIKDMRDVAAAFPFAPQTVGRLLPRSG